MRVKRDLVKIEPKQRRMITNRLQLALERLAPSDWQRFERIASGFLATEFDELRTTASASGDEGRDSELYSPVAEPNVVLQYSVATDWAAKINATVRRLKNTHPGVLSLIYVTNQLIGAGGDELKRRLRKEGISLDVRDRSWFLERVLGSPAREQLAEELAATIVDPYLASRGVTNYAPSELSSPEAVAAITFLGLQWQDEIRDKGLTKLAFEALARAALENTDSDNRLPRQAIYQHVCRLLPSHPAERVRGLIDAALRQLTKKAIRHWPKLDEFCLTYEEKERVLEFKTVAALSENELLLAIQKITKATLSARKIPPACEPELTRCLDLPRFGGRVTTADQSVVSADAPPLWSSCEVVW